MQQLREWTSTSGIGVQESWEVEETGIFWI